MDSFFNPFAILHETNLSPHSRTLRSSLMTKVVDAFWVLSGNAGMAEFDNVETKSNLGIFDYFTLGIPAILYWLLIQTYDLYNDDQELLLVPLIIIGAINLPLIVIRYFSAVIVTLISLPIILMVHVCAKLSYLGKGDQLEAEALSLKQPLQAIGTQSGGGHQTIAEFLRGGSKSIEEFDLHLIEKKDKPLKLALTIKSPNGYAVTSFETPINSTDAQQRKAIKAIIQLNFGGFSTYLEEDSSRYEKFRQAFGGSASSEQKGNEKASVSS